MRGNPETDPAARARLAKLIDERRVQLGLTWNEVAERAGLTKEGLRTVRQETRKIMPLTKGGIQEALQWAPGSIDRILSGGEPIEVRHVSGVATLALAATAIAHAVAAGTAVETETANEITPRSVPRWLTAELERRGANPATVVASVEAMREAAAHFGYSLAELLIEAGLVDAGDVELRDPLDDFRRKTEEILADPRLSRGQRKDVERYAKRKLAELEGKGAGPHNP